MKKQKQELLTEQHVILPKDKRYEECARICHLSKNLYNASLYEVRQYFFQNGKYLNYNKVNKQFTDNKQTDYIALPRKVGKMIQMKLESNFKSFFALLKKYKAGELEDKPSIPHYLPKDGYYVTEYTKQAISFKKNGYLQPSQTNLLIKPHANLENIKALRIVPQSGYFVIEILHKMHKQELLSEDDTYASIDLGINNLMTVTSTEFQPFIINGKPLKSINQYYNKQKAKYQSILQKENKQHYSNRLHKFDRKRKFKINDYLHKAVSYLMNQLVNNKIHTLVLGYNKGWKQDINLGKVNNQNFTEIPFYKLKDMLAYKCLQLGINFIVQEESYTSKASFLDNDKIPIYHEGKKSKTNFSGYRKARGLYKSKVQNKYINADVNGSYNILKKYLKKVSKNIYDYIDLAEACSKPKIVNVSVS